ncbi:MAG: hypothetical protein WC978_00225 [bacterium]
MSEPKKFYYGDPPAERERKRIEAEEIKERLNWVRSRRTEYPNNNAFEADRLRAMTSWEDIKGPDGKGAER